MNHKANKGIKHTHQWVCRKIDVENNFMYAECACGIIRGETIPQEQQKELFENYFGQRF